MPDQTNRRREARMEMTSTAAVLLECRGGRVEAYLTDFSRHGAGFRVEVCPEGLDLQTGDEVSWTLKTIYGDSVINARIAWAKKDGQKYDFGVEIVEKDNENKKEGESKA